MVNIPLNVDVEGADGLCGQSTRVIVDPETLQATHLVVKEKEKPHTERLVPADLVLEATANSIRLCCTVDQLAQLEPFFVTEHRQLEIPRYVGVEFGYTSPYYAPRSEWVDVRKEHIPAGTLAIGPGMQVEAIDGKAGRVDEVIVDQSSGQITHLVLREGHLFEKKDVLVPMSMVDSADQETVYLKLDKQTIASLLAIPVSQWHEAKDLQLLVKTLNQAEQATEALKTLKPLSKSKSMLNAAAVVKDEAGKTSLTELEDVGRKQGALFGAITGGLIGLLGGPIGAVVGAAAGAATGTVATNWLDMGFPDEYLKKFQEHLTPGAAAIVALVKTDHVDEITTLLSNFAGELLLQPLSGDMVAQLTTQTGTEDDDAETA